MAKHPNKHIRAAIKYAESKGWVFVKAGSHAHIFGTLLCPNRAPEGHRVSIFSTPKNPENHAKWIRRHVDRCDH